MSGVPAFTSEQKRRYLEDPNYCPYCGSDKIEGSRVEVEFTTARQVISCRSCGSRWADLYQLSDIEPVNLH